MTSPDPKAIAEGLHLDARDLLRLCSEEWFRAADLSWSKPATTGSALTRFSERGLLERASDETTWGRGKYRLTPLGLAVRQELEKMDGHH